MNIKYSFCISLDITPAGEAGLGWAGLGWPGLGRAGVQRGDDAFTAIKCEGLEQRNWFHNLLTIWIYHFTLISSFPDVTPLPLRCSCFARASVGGHERDNYWDMPSLLR